MTSETCKQWNTCEAPLCPEDKRSLEYGLWYGDEEVCPMLTQRSLKWIQRQRKLVKFGKKLDDGFFTVKMLLAVKSLSKGIQGANPDSIDTEASWLAKRGLSVAK